MNEDSYPKAYLVKRLFDVVLFFISIICLLIAVAVGFCSEEPEQRLIISLGMMASAIAAILEFRQKSLYENDHVESSILSDGLQANYLNSIAKLRHKLVAANVLIVLAGLWVSGYGVVWKSL